MKQDINKKTIKKYFLTDAEAKQIANNLRGQAQSMYLLVLNTGATFTDLKNKIWSEFNSIKQTIIIHDKDHKLPSSVNSYLLQKREDAISEKQKIFKLLYRSYWQSVSRQLYKSGFENCIGVNKLVRNTFIKKHYEIYRDKEKLRQDLNLTTLRYIDKRLFKLPTQNKCLFENAL